MHACGQPAAPRPAPAIHTEEHAAGGQPQWGTLVSPGVNAHIHQHFFQVRCVGALQCVVGACLQARPQECLLHNLTAAALPARPLSTCQVRLDMAVDDPDGGACLQVRVRLSAWRWDGLGSIQHCPAVLACTPARLLVTRLFTHTHSICTSVYLQVVEVEAEPMPLGPGNPHGVGFDVTQRVLERESEAQRMCAPERSRVWKVGGGGRWGGCEWQSPATVMPTVLAGDRMSGV